MPLPSWEEISATGFLDRWAMDLIVMNVATRKFCRAVRLPEAGVPADAGSGLSRSAVSRRFKALTQATFEEWMGSDRYRNWTSLRSRSTGYIWTTAC